MGDNVPVYDWAFYDSIIAERRKLGATDQYVSIDECMITVGRTFDSDQGDNSHSSPVKQ